MLSAQKSRLVSLLLKMCISSVCVHTFSWQTAGRHNTLDFAYGKIVCQRGLLPLWKPPPDRRKVLSAYRRATLFCFWKHITVSKMTDIVPNYTLFAN
jgi:hypothetical protein